MSRIDELRKNAKVKEEEFNCRVESLKKKTAEVLNSDAFNLSMMAHAKNIGSDPGTLDRMSEQIVTGIVEQLTDPVAEFKDIMVNRHISEIKTRRLVDEINRLFHLTDKEDDYAKLEAVALYLSQHKYMYDDLSDYC